MVSIYKHEDVAEASAWHTPGSVASLATPLSRDRLYLDRMTYTDLRPHDYWHEQGYDYYAGLQGNEEYSRVIPFDGSREGKPAKGWLHLEYLDLE